MFVEKLNAFSKNAECDYSYSKSFILGWNIVKCCNINKATKSIKMKKIYTKNVVLKQLNNSSNRKQSYILVTDKCMKISLEIAICFMRYKEYILKLYFKPNQVYLRNDINLNRFLKFAM